MRTLTIMLFLLVIFSIPTLADSGSYLYDFPNPQPFKPSEDEIEHPDVVMVDEFVSIVLGAEGAVVNAEFTFRNEGAAQTVPMYFPLEHYSGMIDFSREELNEMDFISEEESTQGEYPKWNEFYGIEEITSGKYSFSASVNDSKVEVKVILERAGRVEDSLGERDYYDAGYFYRDIYAIYEVPFAVGETLTLSVEYHQWYDFPPKGGGWCRMIYPIYTGGSWKGAIGHGVVEVTAGSDFDWNGAWQYQSVSLPPAVEKSGKLIWEFDELEPERDSLWGTCVIVVMPWEFYKTGSVESESAYGRVPGDNQSCWGIVIASDGINFRSNRSNTSTWVSAHPVMNEGEFFTVFERQGDWWRVEDEEGNSGWLRWRYVDDDKENIYAALSSGHSIYHALSGMY